MNTQYLMPDRDSPTYSEDGEWMWNGNEWIPTPPGFISNKEIIPSSPILPDNKSQGKTKIKHSKTKFSPKIVAIVLVIVILGGYFALNNDEENSVDMYVTYGVFCADCSIVTADLDLIDGTVDSVIGFPDEDGAVRWEFHYSIYESALDRNMFAYIIASHDEDGDVLFSTYIEIDDFPHGQGDNNCLLDWDTEYGSSASGSGGWFSYNEVVNSCDSDD